MLAGIGDSTKTIVTNTMAVSTKSMLGDTGRQQSPASGVSEIQCEQLARYLEVDDAPSPAR